MRLSKKALTIIDMQQYRAYGLGYLQAVEATLGRGTCKLVPTRDKPRSKAPTLTCSECGWWTDEIGKAWNYCPSCGRRVIG